MTHYFARLYRRIFWSKARRQAFFNFHFNEALRRSGLKEQLVDQLYAESPIMKRLRK